MSRPTKDGEWTFRNFQDSFADPATCLISYCLPCVQYGMTAEKVHGPDGSCVNHGAKVCLYSCVCLGGLVAGPTRKAIRRTYKLPADPAGLGKDEMTDCLLYTIPCTACFAMCQDANEMRARAPAGHIDARPFDWAPVPGAMDAPVLPVTAAPAQAAMTKDAAPAAPAPAATPAPAAATQ